MLPTVRGNGWLGTSLNPALGRFRDEFDGLFERIIDDGSNLAHAWSGVPTAVWEDQDYVHIQVDLPGVTRSDVELTVHNGVLTIKGERKQPKIEGVRYLFNTRQFGAFERSLKLSSAVDPATVKASFENGVLKIELGKAEASKPRKIEIQSN